MADVDELSVGWEEDGREIVRELDKVILTKGAWATIAYLYQDWDDKVDGFGKPKITFRRYQKRQGVYRERSKFNISSMKQANQIHELLTNWLKSHGEK